MVSVSRVFMAGVLASGVQSASLTSKWFESAVNVLNGNKIGSLSDSLKNVVVDVFPGNNDDRPVPGDLPIVQCEATTHQILNLQSVTLDPNPPVRGANLTFTAVGYLQETIEDGAYVEVDVRYGYIKLLHQTFDLCEEIQKVDLECPIKKGPQALLKEVEIPAEVPPGKYIVNARAYTKDDEFITCLNAVVDFPPA